MSKFLKFIIVTLFFSFGLTAQEKTATSLPNISLIGNFVGQNVDGARSFGVEEVELSFQHYLYPGVKADVFIGLGKHEEGEEEGGYEVSLEEAYVTFMSLPATLFPNSSINLPLGAMVGQKLLAVGRLNALHPEQWAFVDRPVVHQKFFGEGHGLAGQGGQLAYLLPLPFFSQLEVGYWTAVSAHGHEGGAEEEGDDEAHGVEHENAMLHARLWNSFKIGNASEVSVGLSSLTSNFNADEDNDKSAIMAFDVNLVRELSNNKSLDFQVEWFQAKYGEEGEEGEEAAARETQDGFVFTTLFNFSKLYSAGVRYSSLGKHGDEGEDVTQVAYQITRQLTETSKFRIQHNVNDNPNAENVTLVQFIFGMGPHSHVLQ